MYGPQDKASKSYYMAKLSKNVLKQLGTGVKNQLSQLFTFTIQIDGDRVEIDPEVIILKNPSSEIASQQEK